MNATTQKDRAEIDPTAIGKKWRFWIEGEMRGNTCKAALYLNRAGFTLKEASDYLELLKAQPSSS